MRNVDDGFDNSWTGATVQKSKGNKFAVEYSAFVDDKVRARVRVRANPNPDPDPNPNPNPNLNSPYRRQARTPARRTTGATKAVRAATVRVLG